MFCKDVVETDKFLDLPASAQSFYFHLGMNADDDGFVSNFKSRKRMYGASDDDARLLCAKGYIYPFDSGVVVITHWKIHNYIKKDRYQKTIHQQEYAQLSLSENKTYILNGKMVAGAENISIPATGSNLDPECIQNGTGLEPQVSIGKSKDRLGKVRVSVYDRTAAFTLGDEILYQEDYENLTHTHSRSVVDSVINRIISTPYHGKLNPSTIDQWASEKENSIGGNSDQPTANDSTSKSKFSDIAETLEKERR